MNASANASAPRSQGSAPLGDFTVLSERFSVELITGGEISEYTNNLTRVARAAEFTNGTDMAAHMRILEPLRGWLEINGALTPGSGVLVRTLSDRLRPEDILEERALPGIVVDRRELVTVLREPHDPTGM